MPQVERATAEAFGSTSGATLSHTVAAGVELLVVDVASSNNVTANPLGVTYAGQAMTLHRFIANGSFSRVSRWLLVDPPEGTANVVVASGSAGGRCVVAARSLEEVDTGDPVETGGATTATSLWVELSMPSATVDHLSMDAFGTQQTVDPVFGGPLPGRVRDYLENLSGGAGSTHITATGSHIKRDAPTLTYSLDGSPAWAFLADAFNPGDTEPPPDTDVAALQPNAILAAEGLTPNLATVQQDPETAGGWLAIP